jgi:hypothetical protein
VLPAARAAPSDVLPPLRPIGCALPKICAVKPSVSAAMAEAEAAVAEAAAAAAGAINTPRSLGDGGSHGGNGGLDGTLSAGVSTTTPRAAGVCVGAKGSLAAVGVERGPQASQLLDELFTGKPPVHFPLLPGEAFPQGVSAAAAVGVGTGAVSTARFGAASTIGGSAPSLNTALGSVTGKEGSFGFGATAGGVTAAPARASIPSSGVSFGASLGPLSGPAATGAGAVPSGPPPPFLDPFVLQGIANVGYPMLPGRVSEISPLTPAVGGCSTMATVCDDLERLLADAMELEDADTVGRCRRALRVVRDMILQRLDTATAELLERSMDYVGVHTGLAGTTPGAEVGAAVLGMDELMSADHFDVLPLPVPQLCDVSPALDPSDVALALQGMPASTAAAWAAAGAGGAAMGAAAPSARVGSHSNHNNNASDDLATSTARAQLVLAQSPGAAGPALTAGQTRAAAGNTDAMPPASASSLTHTPAGPYYSSFAKERIAGEVIVWASLNENKVSRNKVVRNVLIRDKPNNPAVIAAADAVSTLSVELHKQVASINGALRVVRCAYDHAAGAALYQERQEAAIATQEGVQADMLDAANDTATAGAFNLDAARKARLQSRMQAGAAAGSTSLQQQQGAGATGAGAKPSSTGASRKGKDDSEDGGSDEEAKEDEDDAADDENESSGDNEEADEDADPDGEGKEGEHSGEEGSGEEGEKKSRRRKKARQHKRSANQRKGAAAAAGPAQYLLPGGVDYAASMRPVGGTLHIELLALPKPPVADLKGWAVARTFPALAPPGTVRRLPHPANGQGSLAAAQAIKVKVKVPPDVVVQAAYPMFSSPDVLVKALPTALQAAAAGFSPSAAASAPVPMASSPSAAGGGGFTPASAAPSLGFAAPTAALTVARWEHTSVSHDGVLSPTHGGPQHGHRRNSMHHSLGRRNSVFSAAMDLSGGGEVAEVQVPPNPVVCAADLGLEGTGRWVTTDVLEPSFDPASRVLSFNTVQTAAHALVQPRHLDMPYVYWTITPVPSVTAVALKLMRARARAKRLSALGRPIGDLAVEEEFDDGGDDGRDDAPEAVEDGSEAVELLVGSDDSFGVLDSPNPLNMADGPNHKTTSDRSTAAVLSIATPRFTVSILVETDGMCRLLGPAIPELRKYIGNPVTGMGATLVPPGQLLYLLHRCGITLLPHNSMLAALEADREVAAAMGKQRAAVAAAVAATAAAAFVPLALPPIDGGDDAAEGKESEETPAGDGVDASKTAEEDAAVPIDGGDADKEIVEDSDQSAASSRPRRFSAAVALHSQGAYFPLQPKETALERTAYSELARVCAGHTIACSNWNAHPNTDARTVVVKTMETVRSPLDDTAALLTSFGSATPFSPLEQPKQGKADQLAQTSGNGLPLLRLPSLLQSDASTTPSTVGMGAATAFVALSPAAGASATAGDAPTVQILAGADPAEDPTQWLTLAILRDEEISSGIRAMLTVDTETGADEAWVASMKEQTALGADLGGLSSGMSAVVLSDTAMAGEVSEAPSFTAKLEPLGETHSSAKLAMAPRSSAEANLAVDQASPLFLQSMERLLRLIRPISFTQ